MKFKYTHAMAALSIALVTAPSANANIIIENLYITNPDGTTVDGDEWDTVSFTWNDQTVPLLGVRGENGKNYVYLDVDISAETNNNPSPSITVEHGFSKRVVKANWSIDMHVRKQLVVTESLSDYKILGRPDLVPRYMNLGESIALCPARKLKPMQFSSLESDEKYVLIAVGGSREGGLADYVLRNENGQKVNPTLEYRNDLYASPWNAQTKPDGKRQNFPSTPEWSLSTGTDFQRSMSDTYMRKDLYGDYITVKETGHAVANPYVTQQNMVDISTFMGQMSDECISQSTLERQYLLSVTYGNPPSHPGAAIPVVF